MARGDLDRPDHAARHRFPSETAPSSRGDLPHARVTGPPGVPGRSVPQRPAHGIMAAEIRPDTERSPHEGGPDGATRRQGGHGDRERRRARLRAGHRAAAGGRGADLVLTDIAPAGRPRRGREATDQAGGGLEAVADEVRAAGRRAVVAQVDVRRGRSGASAPSTWPTGRFGRIDILVNNAAAPPGADRVPVVELPEEAWHVILEDEPHRHVSLQQGRPPGSWWRAARPGRIINMSSNCGKVGVRAAGRVLRLQVRRDRVHPGPRHGAGARPASR